MSAGIDILRRNALQRIRIVGSRRAVAREMGVSHFALTGLLAGRRPQERNRVKYLAWNKEYYGERLQIREPRKRDQKEIDAAIKRINQTIRARPLDERAGLYAYAENKILGLKRH